MHYIYRWLDSTSFWLWCLKDSFRDSTTWNIVSVMYNRYLSKAFPLTLPFLKPGLLYTLCVELHLYSQDPWGDIPRYWALISCINHVRGNGYLKPPNSKAFSSVLEIVWVHPAPLGVWGLQERSWLQERDFPLENGPDLFLRPRSTLRRDQCPRKSVFYR